MKDDKKQPFKDDIDIKHSLVMNLSSVKKNPLMTKMMAGMAIDRQNKYEEARQ